MPTPANLRSVDMIAKLAGVSLKNTLRVLHALDAYRAHYGDEHVDVPTRFIKPSPEEIATCESAYRDVVSDPKTMLPLRRVRRIKYMSALPDVPY